MPDAHLCFAAAASKILAQPGTLTGSIGVAASSWDLTDALETWGLDVETVAVGTHAEADHSNWLSRPNEQQARHAEEDMDR